MNNFEKSSKKSSRVEDERFQKALSRDDDMLTQFQLEEKQKRQQKIAFYHKSTKNIFRRR
jgi:hypothetical protein